LSALENRTFRAVTVIWGAEFVGMFLRVGVRSLLAAGNLPDLARKYRVAYTIYTTSEDARAIEAAPVFQRLRESVDVQLSLFAADEIDPRHYGSHGVLWERALDSTKRNREILIFLIPDIVYAKGTLLRWAAKFEQGCRALYTPGPQVVLETILPELEAAVSPDGCRIEIDDADVARLGARHLHPMHCGMLREARRRVPFIEYDIRPVDGRGFVFREITAQPFCLDPSYFNQIVNFSPADHLNAVETLPCTCLSVEPLLKRAEWYYRPWRLDGTRISQLGEWWNQFGPPGCTKDSETVHAFCLSDGPPWHEALRRAERAGRFLRTQLVVARQIYRLFVSFKIIGLNWSAAMIAAALFQANLRRESGIRPGALLFVPHDKAFTDVLANRFLPLLAPSREHDLVNLIRDHALPATSAATPLDARLTARGLPFGSIAAGATILSGPHAIDSFKVYVIDRILWRDQPISQIQPAPEFPEPPVTRQSNGSRAPTAIPPDAQAMLRDVCVARVLQSAEDILAEYEDSALSASPVRSAPLALVRELMTRNGLASGGRLEVFESLLTELITRYPDWTEAWLELGFIRVDQGRDGEDVLACFAQAVAGTPRNHDAQYLDPRAIAQTTLARLLERQGRLAEAAAAYSASFKRTSDQRAAAAEFARLLCRLGRYQESLEYFQAGMMWEDTRSQVPRMGRNARDLALASLQMPPSAASPPQRANETRHLP
jgi:hypothetical protein